MKSNNELKIGFGKINITPKKGVPLAGTSTLRANDGVLHPIFARVMVLEQGGRRHVILGVDSLGIKQEIVDRLKEKTSRLKVFSILCNASHTHCAPDAYDGFYVNMDDKSLLRLKESYQVFLEKKLFEVIKEACSKLKKGSLRFNDSEEAGFAVNRRRFYNGAWQLMPNFKKKIDKRVSVISAHHPDETLMGVVYSYTCHTTTYYSMNQVAGDFVSECSQLIESETGVSTVFLQGPCADIRPALVNPEKPEFFGRTTPQDLHRISQELGSAVLRSLRKKGRKLKPELEAITTHVHLPIQLEMSDARIEAVIRNMDFPKI